MDNSIRTFAILGMAALAFTPTTSTASQLPPDLCAEPVLKVDGSPYQDSTGLELSRWCAPRVDPPVWDGAACCVVTDEANCVLTDDVKRDAWLPVGDDLGQGVGRALGPDVGQRKMSTKLRQFLVLFRLSCRFSGSPRLARVARWSCRMAG